MNRDEALVARDNKTAVVDTYTGELGVIENLKQNGDGVMVLYLGNRLARLVQLNDLAAVSVRAYNATTEWAVPLGGAGKVHGGPKGAEGK